MSKKSPVVAALAGENVPKKGIFSGAINENLQAIGRKIRSHRAALAKGWV